MSVAVTPNNKLSVAFNAALILGVLALAVALIWMVVTQASVMWVDVIYDDAYYYLGIARGVVEAGKSSFLPPFVTNGYQPLWLLLLSALAWVFGVGERAMVIQMICLTLAFVVVFSLLSKQFYGRMWPALLIAAAFPAVMIFGLETVMLPVYVLCYFNTPARRMLPRGVLASAIFLTRLDALAFVLVNDAYAILVKRRSLAELKHWAILLPVIAIYFGVNWIWFGSPVPVSGLAKAVGNHVGENVEPLLIFADNARFVIPLVLLLLALHRFSRGAVALRHVDEIVVLSITALLCIGYYFLMSGWSIWPWYLWALMLVVYFLVLDVTDIVAKSVAQRRVGFSTLVVAMIALALLYDLAKWSQGTAIRYSRLAIEVAHDKINFPSYGRKNVQLAEAIAGGLIPKGAYIAMGDRAGSLGYFIGNAYRFIHTEGLVGPKEYVDAMRADQGRQFIDRLGVDYFITDREHYADRDGVLGFSEPVQGLSAHVGPYLLCFDKSGVISNEAYLDQTRLVIDFHRRVQCPSRFEEEFLAQRSVYSGVRRFALPGEQERSVVRRLLGAEPPASSPRAGAARQ